MWALLDSLACCTGPDCRAASDECKAEVPASGTEVGSAPIDPKIEAVVEAAKQQLPGAVMTDWQRAWCTPETVGVYLRGRNGNVAAAAQILAQALSWRLEYREVLAGARLPRWQSDFRIIARGEDGHPLVYLCYRHHVPPNDPRAIVEHGACVLEAAIRAMRRGARQFDVVIDCHGFGGVTSPHLSPKGAFPVLKMIQQPYRERLRTAILVGAPSTFSVLFSLCSRLMSEDTRRKAIFLTPDEATARVLRTGGLQAAWKLREVMALSRQGLDCRPGEVDGRRLPSELEGGGSAGAEGGAAARQERGPVGGGGSSSGGPEGGFPAVGGCCRRRHRRREDKYGARLESLQQFACGKLQAARKLWHMLG